MCNSQGTTILFPLKSVVDAFFSMPDPLAIKLFLCNFAEHGRGLMITFCTTLKKYNKNTKPQIYIEGLQCWTSGESCLNIVFLLKCCKLIKTLKSFLDTTFTISFTNLFQIRDYSATDQRTHKLILRICFIIRQNLRPKQKTNSF